MRIFYKHFSMKGFTTIIFLVISNTFMTCAWYGHLKFKEMSWGQNLGLFAVIRLNSVVFLKEGIG